MNPDFRTALARLVPVFMPDLLFRLTPNGEPLFKEFAAAIRPTEFAPGKFFGTGTLAPIDYCVELAEGRIAPPANLDIATIQDQELAMSFRFHVQQYLSRRAADWKARGFTETLTDFAALNRRSKFWGDDGRAAFRNWEEVADPRNTLGGRQGVDERIMLRELLRRVDMMVMLENRLDALVRLHTPLPPAKIGGAPEPGVRQNLRLESFYGPNAGLTEVLIPAGYVTTVYDPVFKLSPDRTRYLAGRHRHADHDPGAGTAVFAGVPRRTGSRRCAAADRVRLRGRLEAPHPAAGIWPVVVRADTTSRLARQTGAVACQPG